MFADFAAEVSLFTQRSLAFCQSVELDLRGVQRVLGRMLVVADLAPRHGTIKLKREYTELAFQARPLLEQLK